MELKCQNSHDFALWAPIFKMYSYFWIGFKLEKKPEINYLFCFSMKCIIDSFLGKTSNSSSSTFFKCAAQENTV